jgi:hypothetical protein
MCHPPQTPRRYAHPSRHTTTHTNQYLNAVASSLTLSRIRTDCET